MSGELRKRRRQHLISMALGVGVAITLSVFLAYRATRPSIVVSVRNSRASAAANVRVAIGGLVLSLGTISPGQTAGGGVDPVADSHVAVFLEDPDGTDRVANVDTYVTHGVGGRIDMELREEELIVLRNTVYPSDPNEMVEFERSEVDRIR